MNIIIDYLVSIILTVETIFSLLPNMVIKTVSYSPEENDCLLNCAVVSDTHADTNIFRDRTDNLRKAYAGISKCGQKIDVVLNIGDITNSGSRKDYRTQKILEKVYLKSDYKVSCFGNHDSWNGSADPDYETAKNLFLKYLKSNGITSGSVYYSTVIKGYYFICLGTESLDLHDDLPLYSDEQFKWFDDQLTNAEKSGLPVFVLSHRPVSGKNAINDSVVPKEVENILQNHSSYDKPILFFSGHCHTFSPSIYDKENNIYYINLPSLEYNDESEYECNDKGGMGLTMEVYEDSIILKARNFIKDKFIDNYRFEIDY